MPLSEHEQRMLEQMERALYEEDPRFAATIRDTPPPVSKARRGAGLGVLVAAVGVIAMIAGLVANAPAASVLGFVALVFGTYNAIRGATREGRTERRTKGGFMQRAEERFNERRDNRPDRP